MEYLLLIIVVLLKTWFPIAMCTYCLFVNVYFLRGLQLLTLAGRNLTPAVY